MGVTSFGPHTRPGCNLGHCRDLFFVLNDVDLYTVCFLLTFGDARGLGLNCVCVPLVTRLYAVRSIKLCQECGSTSCVCGVLFPMGSRDLDAHIWELVTSFWSRVLNAWFWLVEKNFAALWLVSPWCSLHHYSQLDWSVRSLESALSHRKLVSSIHLSDAQLRDWRQKKKDV